MKVVVYIEGERLDLFNDESISITQGVQDVKDISKLFADFSQSFNVPASKRNNSIFKHYYNADIDGGFDARTRKTAHIEVNTIPFKTGKIQLEGVEVKDNEPSSYKITFFGDAIKIKDLIGDDKLFDLDWLDNFDHAYSDSQVLNALQNGLDFTVDGTLYERAIVYPLISYKRQFKYDSDPSDTTSEDKLVNIAYDAGRTDGVDYRNLKPAIKLSLIVEAINRKYGFNFTGGFFDSLDYQELYMPLNATTESIISGIKVLEDVSGSYTPSNGVFSYAVTINPSIGFGTIPYKIKLEVNGQVVYEDQDFIAGNRGALGLSSLNPDTYNVKCTIESNTSAPFGFIAVTSLFYRTPSGDIELFTNNYFNQFTELKVLVNSLNYDIKVYDFLTSLFKMFNLVVVADGDSLLVKDLQTWYSEGQIYDVSRYVDTRKLSIDKGEVYNEFNFKFEESSQILANQFNKNNRRYYGDLDLRLYADNNQTTLLDGESLDIEVIFERPINERLLDLNTGNQTNIQYCLYLDEKLDEITGNPFLIYCDSQTLSGNSIGFVDESGGYSEISSFIFMPSQTRNVLDASSFSVNFNTELSEFTYQAMIENIYSKYYADYIGDIFSIKRRNYKLDCILPSHLLNKLKLNDRLVIGDRRYLINKITSNLVKRKDTIELINDIYSAPIASDIIGGGSFRRQSSIYTALAQSDTAQYIGDTTNAVNLIDTGDGTSWVTIDNDPQTLIRTVAFSIAENSTGATRRVTLRIINETLTFADFVIIQSS